MANVQRVIPTPLGHSVAKVVRGSTIFEDAQSCYLTRTPSTAGNKRTSTRSYWIKFTQPDDDYDVTVITGGGSSGNYRYHSGLNSNKTYYRYERLDGNDKVDVNTGSACYRDYGSWYHFVEVIDTPRTTAADRFRFYVNGSRVDLTFNTSYPQNYEGLVNDPTPNHIGARYDASNDELCANMCEHYFLDGQSLGPEYFGYTDPLTGNWRPKKYTQGVFKEMDKWTCDTYNSWNSGQTSLRYQGTKFLTSDGGKVGWRATGSSNTGLNVYTSTDNSTWTRKLSSVTVDSTGLYYESSEQYVIIVNGSDANWSNEQVIISDQNGAKIHYSNGTYPGNGSPTMSWTGPAYSDGTLGSYNSFYLPLDGTGFSAFDTIGNMVEDQSGLQNNHTSNGAPRFGLDSPSGVPNSIDTTAGISTFPFSSNYAVWNYSDKGDTVSVSEGGIRQESSTYSTSLVKSTFGMTAGKYYFEYRHTQKPSGGWSYIGVMDEMARTQGSSTSDDLNYKYDKAWSYNSNGSVTHDDDDTAYGDSWSNGDVIGCAFDVDQGKIWFSKNGTWQNSGNPETGVNPAYDDIVTSTASYYGGRGNRVYVVGTSIDTNTGTGIGELWSGAEGFLYTPPKGFAPMCSNNSPVGVSNPSQYFKGLTYTGNNTSNPGNLNTISCGFQPDLLWIKDKNNTWPHLVFDTARGRDHGDALRSFWYWMTDSSSTPYQYGGSGEHLRYFNGDGFVMGGASGYSNYNNNTYLAMAWKAGGGNIAGSQGDEFWKDGKQYASAALADVGSGTITPTACSVGTTPGLSILQYTGTATAGTIAHGLNKAPECIWVKCYNQDSYVYHTNLDPTTPWIWYAHMNTTAVRGDSGAVWNDTAPTDTLIHIGGDDATNESGQDILMYAWHSVPGLSKFNHYMGNGNSDGNYVHCGFKPGFILIKKLTGTENWQMHTTALNPNNETSNAAGNRLFANTTAAMTTQPNLDILGDGFKLRTTDASVNSNGTTYFYCAWADESSSGQYGGQATGR